MSIGAHSGLQGKQAVRDGQGVLACLKRALKVANAAQQQVGRGGWAGWGGRLGGGRLPVLQLMHVNSQSLRHSAPHPDLSGAGAGRMGALLQLAVAAKGNDAGAASLFVEALNHYLYYFDQGCQLVTAAVLQASSRGLQAAAARGGTWIASVASTRPRPDINSPCTKCAPQPTL